MNILLTKLPSVIEGDNADVWKRILEHYANIISNRPVKVADITAGEKRMWKKIDYKAVDLYGNRMYDITFVDVKGGEDVIEADYRSLPLKNMTYDIVVFDPPYADPLGWTKRPRDTTKEIEEITYLYNLNNGVLKEKDIIPVTSEVARILKRGRYWIIKLQDTKYEWHYKFYNKIRQFGYFKYLGLVVQSIPFTWHMHIPDKSFEKPQPCHTYWMIYKLL